MEAGAGDATLVAVLARWTSGMSSGGRGRGTPGGDSIDPAPADVSGALDPGVIAGLHELDPEGDGMAHLIETFVRDTVVRLDDLRCALESGDDALVALTSHSLRGSAANLGASRMAEICAELQLAAANHNLAVGTDTMGRLRAEFDRVRPLLIAEFPRAAS